MSIAAEEFVPEAPRPLSGDIPPALPYPVEQLGPILALAAKALNRIVQAPDAICAQSVLAAAALAVQGHADVEINGRQHPISENFVTIGVSGERSKASNPRC